MKLKKQNLIEKKIYEAEYPAEEAVPAEPVTVDPKKDDCSDIVQSVVDGVKSAADADLTVSPIEAAKAAMAIKDVGSKIDNLETTITTPLTSHSDVVLDSALTRHLDNCLHQAQKYRRGNENGEGSGRKAGANLLISGLPGSGKTASVNAWADNRGIYLHYLDAKNPDLETILNGFPVRDAEDSKSVIQAFSKVLEPLQTHENCVLFLDELNRQVKDHIRASLLTLINEKTVSGRGPGGKTTFPNLLFTVACINPACSEDKGAARLNSAELSRFTDYLRGYDSDPETCEKYLNANYLKLANKLNKNNKYYNEDLEDILRILNLGIFIVQHEDFKFDGEDTLSDLYNTQSKMLNQRALTDGLEYADGSVTRFSDWLKEAAGFLPATTKMLQDILEDYDEPSFEDLCKIYGFDGAVVDEPEEAVPETPAVPEAPVKSEPIEDDEDFFGGATVGAKNSKIKSAAEVQSIIKGISF